MTHLDLFSGIGGFALAAERVWPEIEHTFCEIDPFCQAVLKKHWPKSKIYEDIRRFKGEAADLITGGFPCQPFSSAGQRKGKEDDRDLWPEMFRIIQETRPTWVVGENVAGFINMELHRSLSDLESEGFEIQTFVIPACAVNAPHRRDRIWIIAYSYGNGRFNARRGSKKRRKGEALHPFNSKIIANTESDNVERSIKQQESELQQTGTNAFSGAWQTAQILLPSAVLCRTDDGIPNRVDRTKSLGNAVVPQVAEEIFKAIKNVCP